MFGAGLICGAYMTKVAPALPLQRAELGLSLLESGFIATTFNVIGGLAGILAGTLCDRFGHRRLALGGLAILALSGLLGAAALEFPAAARLALFRRHRLHPVHGFRLRPDLDRRRAIRATAPRRSACGPPTCRPAAASRC